MTAYMTSCSTAKTENSEAPMPKRAVAYSAATLSDERWNTATRVREHADAPHEPGSGGHAHVPHSHPPPRPRPGGAARMSG